MGGKGGDGGAGAAMQTALNNQANVSNKVINSADQFMAQNNQYYNTPLQGATNSINGNLGAVAPGLQRGLGQLLGSGGDLSGQTGVNQNALAQMFTQYASNPQNTNLSHQNGALTGFYGNEMRNGLDQGFAQNQQNQIQQNLQTSLNTARGRQAPGQNVNALEKDLTNQSIASSTNLAGQLGAENQQVMNKGAEGLSQTATNQDSQIMTMLQQAFSGGQGFNSQALQNLVAALGQGQGALGNAVDFTKIGANNVISTNSALGGIAQSSAAEAAEFGKQAAAKKNSGSLLGGLIGLGATALTGGAAGAGGLGTILKGV